MYINTYIYIYIYTYIHAYIKSTRLRAGVRRRYEVEPRSGQSSDGQIMYVAMSMVTFNTICYRSSNYYYD